MRLGGLIAASFAALFLFASDARAEWRPKGSLSTFLVLEPETEGAQVGVGTRLSIWENFGPLELGGTVGILTLRHEDDDADQLVAPIGLHLGLGTVPDPIGVRLIGAAGVWAGATNQGLRASAWFAAGVILEARLDDTLALGLDFQGMRLWGELERNVVQLGISLTWRPEEFEW